MIATRPGYVIDWPIAAAATVGLFGVAMSNALFAYKLGSMPVVIRGAQVMLDGVVLGALSTVLSVFQARSATMLILGGRGDPKLTAFFLFAICAAYSSAAMGSHVLELQRKQDTYRATLSEQKSSLKDTVANAAEKLSEAKERRAPIEKEFKRLANGRTVVEIERAISSTEFGDGRAYKIWKTSNGCTEVWSRDEDACKPLLSLRDELAGAKARESVQKRLREADAAVDAARAKLDAARKAEAAALDPKKLTDFEHGLRFWIVIVFAAALWAVETFGFAVAFRRAPISPTDIEAPATGNGCVYSFLSQVRDGLVSVEGATVSPDGRVTIGQKALAQALKVSRTTVGNRIKELSGDGRLAVTSGPAGTTFTLF